jgi:hypothetical protein
VGGEDAECIRSMRQLGASESYAAIECGRRLRPGGITPSYSRYTATRWTGNNPVEQACVSQLEQQGYALAGGSASSLTSGGADQDFSLTFTAFHMDGRTATRARCRGRTRAGMVEITSAEMEPL